MWLNVLFYDFLSYLLFAFAITLISFSNFVLIHWSEVQIHNHPVFLKNTLRGLLGIILSLTLSILLVSTVWAETRSSSQGSQPEMEESLLFSKLGLCAELQNSGKILNGISMHVHVVYHPVPPIEDIDKFISVISNLTEKQNKEIKSGRESIKDFSNENSLIKNYCLFEELKTKSSSKHSSCISKRPSKIWYDCGRVLAEIQKSNCSLTGPFKTQSCTTEDWYHYHHELVKFLPKREF